MVKKDNKTKLDPAKLVKHETLAERREERELEALHGEVAELQAQLQEIRSSINAASSSKEAGGRDAVKTLQVDIEQKEKLYQRTLAELRETMAARDQLKQQLAALEHSVESDERVKEQIRQLKEATTKRSKLEAQLVALNEESAVYRQRVEQLERGAAPAVSSSQKSKDKEQEDLIKELQGKFEVLESQREELEGQLRGSGVKITMLEKEKSRLDWSIADLKKQIAAAGKSDSSASTPSRMTAQKEVDNMKVHIKKLEGEKASLTNQHEQLSNKSQTLESQINQLRAQLSKATTSGGATREDLTAHQQEASTVDAAAEQMLQAVSAALNLTGADLQRLKTDPRNADARVSAILGGRSIVETIFALEVELQDAEQDVAQLTSQIDMVQSALAMKQADLARLQGHASEMTPPQSPEMARKVMEEEHHAELEGQAAEAQRNLARERERVTELERRLAAFEAAADDRSTAEVSTKAGSRAASSSGELVKKLMKEFSSVNSQISQLRDENMELLIQLADIDV